MKRYIERCGVISVVADDGLPPLVLRLTDLEKARLFEKMVSMVECEGGRSLENVVDMVLR